MRRYKPPYTITSNILKQIGEISELISDVKHIDKKYRNLTLRKKNRIKSITGTLQIEGNSFSEEKITNVINGKTVLGTVREIEEVKGAIAAYDDLENYNYKQESDLLVAHKHLMNGLLHHAGSYRQSGVGVGNHIAPPASRVPTLMQDIFSWLKSTDEHLLVVSCVFHYEFEFIHPFIDGNGRVGRLWQTVILKSFRDFFGYMPIESIVRDNQTKYYQSLEDAGSIGESTPFIEFMLAMINQSLKEYIKESKNNVPLKVPKNVPLKRLDMLLACISKNRNITIAELSHKFGVTEKTIQRDLTKLKEDNKLKRVGGLKTGHWELINEI